ncbi:hypothetical protein Tco_0269808 [Tanacetum coccineum]
MNLLDIGICDLGKMVQVMDLFYQIGRDVEQKLLLRDVAASFDSAVHRVHAGSFDAVVASLVSAACVAAAAYFVPAALQSSCFEKIYLETWN